MQIGFGQNAQQYKPGAAPRPGQGPSLSQMAAQGMMGGNDPSQYRSAQGGQQMGAAAAFAQRAPQPNGMPQGIGGPVNRQQAYGMMASQGARPQQGYGQMNAQAGNPRAQQMQQMANQMYSQRPAQGGYGQQQMNAQGGRCPTCGK